MSHRLPRSIVDADGQVLWTADVAPTAPPPPAPGPRRLTDADLMKEIIQGGAPAIKAFVARKQAPLECRIAELEARLAAIEKQPTPMHFEGVWAADAIYEAGAVVVHKNAVWTAKKTVQIEPDFNAQAANAWTLMVKPPPRPGHR